MRKDEVGIMFLLIRMKSRMIVAMAIKRTGEQNQIRRSDLRNLSFGVNCLNLVISIPCSIFCDGQSACILRRNVIGNESVFLNSDIGV